MPRYPRGALRGQDVIKHREENGLTQIDLAHRIGVTQSALSQWEHGLVQPSVKNLHRLAKVLDIPMGDLVQK